MTTPPKTHVPNKVPVSTQTCRATGSLQWFLESGNDANYPVFHRNRMNYFVCGEEGFADIATSIKAAKKSIDIVCWGLDPAMELTRDKANTWPRGETWGGLLLDAALGSKVRAPVQVRVLSWFDVIGEKLQHNMPGFVQAAAAPIPPAWQAAVHDTLRGDFKADSPFAKLSLQGKRLRANQLWYSLTKSGQIPGLQLRLRNGSGATISRALADIDAEMPPGFIEDLLVKGWGTYRQKTVLIDYDDTSAQAKPVGYVMGLNSVTDYWDSDQHLYNDPRRETAYGVGADWLAPWHVKPFRDYAMRVEGEALACLNKNFCSAWDAAKATHAGAADKPLRLQRSAIKPPQTGRHRAQIVRTQPEEGDATILKTYTQATSNALNYIYIENQYVQLEHWVNFVKGQREKHLEVFAKGRATALAKNPKAKLPDAPPPLFVFVVMPQAERDEMIPSTYATLAQMGQATTVRGYHSQLQDLSQGRDPGVGTTAKAILKDALAATPSTSSVAADLGRLGINTLTAMLMTYDYANQGSKLRVNARDNRAQSWQAEQEEGTAPDKRAADVVQGDYSQHNIQPQRYREIYIHSKLMLIDDAFITLGSANLNKRSMAGDSELNIAVPDYHLAKAARQRVWGNIAGADLNGGDGSQQQTQDTFTLWMSRMEQNAKARKKPTPPPPQEGSFIHTYDDPRGAPSLRLS